MYLYLLNKRQLCKTQLAPCFKMIHQHRTLKYRPREVCPHCGKGILITDSDMVRNNSQCVVVGPLLLCFLCPCTCPCILCFCCHLAHKRRLCSSCNDEFPGKLVLWKSTDFLFRNNSKILTFLKFFFYFSRNKLQHCGYFKFR